MARHRSRKETVRAATDRGQWLPAAVGIHLGLGIVCFSAVYTGWQTVIITYPQWAVMLGVALVLAYAGLTPARGQARRLWVRLTLGLAGLLAFRLCYDPQIANIPRLGEELPRAFLDTYPGIALIGVVIALACWVLYRNAGGELGLGTIPFRRSVAAVLGLVVVLAVVAHLLLHGPHDLPLSMTLRPILAVLQGGALVYVLLGIGGGPGVGRAPHIYFALTLALAFARNMAFPMV